LQPDFPGLHLLTMKQGWLLWVGIVWFASLSSSSHWCSSNAKIVVPWCVFRYSYVRQGSCRKHSLISMSRAIEWVFIKAKRGPFCLRPISPPQCYNKSINFWVEVCKTEIANLSNSRIRVYCTNELANFSEMAI
jgi:hypothetical protein